MSRSDSWSTPKLVGVIFAGLLAIGAVLTVAERLIGPTSTGSSPDAAADVAQREKPEPPRVERVAPDRVQIRHGLHRTDIRLDNSEADVDRLVECLEQGFAEVLRPAENRAHAAKDASWFERQFDRSPYREELDRVQSDCLNEVIRRPQAPAMR